MNKKEKNKHFSFQLVLHINIYLYHSDISYRIVTCPVLLEAPLLFVSFSFPNDISWRIQCAPVFGESGCM